MTDTDHALLEALILQQKRTNELLEALVRQGDPAQRRILEEADDFVASLKGKTPAEMRALNRERNKRLKKEAARRTV